VKNEMNAGGVAGFQVPTGIKKRKTKVDELLAKHKDLDEGMALSYFSSLSEEQGEEIGVQLDGMPDEVAQLMRMFMARELIKHKVKEVVRKKAGGGGYNLYAPNPGKKGTSKSVGSFPTKLGAKRAELARFPPKEPGKLQRLRKEVDKLQKDPKKAAEKEKAASKKKGTDKGHKKESVVFEATPFQTSASPMASTSSSTQAKTSNDAKSFMTGLKSLQKGTDQYNNYVNDHAKLLSPAAQDNPFRRDVQKLDKTLAASGKPTLTSMLTKMGDTKSNAGFKPGQTKTTVGTQSALSNMPRENIERRIEFMHRTVLSKIITRDLTESLFREERTESEWDDYISKLSKNALAGDSKFQSLQKNISKKTEGILDDAFNTIRKAVGKGIKLKSFGVKHDADSGKTYLAFSASFNDVTAEPIYIHVDGGVPKIHLSQNAKVSLTKTDPGQAKLFRAELVTVQERVLDNMDDLSRAIGARDKYLTKLENEVDSHVASMSPLQISLLKQLLVKKYRKVS